MVAARETTLQELLEGTKQYRVPLYHGASTTQAMMRFTRACAHFRTTSMDARTSDR